MVALSVSGAPAYSDEVSDARRAFVSGMKHFDLGEYRDALADFKDGYRAKEDPVFLYNIAQCYRMLNENGDAIRYYRLYLSRAQDATNRDEIEERITKLQALVDAEDKVRQTQPSPSASPSSAAPNLVPAPPPIAVPRSSTTHTEKPVYKKWWLWTIVGTVAVGGAVGLGVGLSRNPGSAGTTFPTAGF